MTKIAIVGAGLIGRAWAISFARSGADVALWDVDAHAPAAALATIADMLPELKRYGLLDDEPQAVLARIRPVETLEAALDGAAHVQENSLEKLDVKRELFARLDRIAAPETVLASSTSAILPSAFSADLPGRARMLVAHPINPPYLIPAVEIVPAPWTDPDAVKRATALMRQAGHSPIVMAREIDGFVVNRLQGALLEEAFRLVDRGFASADDVDVALKDGLALRWSFMGPFETIDLNAPKGVRDYVARYQSIYEGMFPPGRADWAGPVLATIEASRRAKTPEAELSQRQAWRDRRLMALLAHKRKAADEIGD
ncbi:MAG: 3-hydroxyacyl-CoA dehydrogenase [Pseudomonadota bacterium]|nr:3-hydroxyacyl-CoA dehydrogenase [Pseudomonadota bacterium]